MTSDRRWRFSLSLFLLMITVLGAVFGFLGIFVRWNVEQERLSQTIDPILTRHEAIIAVEQGEIVWLSLSRINPSTTGIPELHEVHITHFYSSVGLPATRPVGDADLIRLIDSMPNLRVLDLRNTNTTAAVLPRIVELDKLEWLWLDAAHCTNVSVEQLHGISSLRRLTIDRTNLSEASLETLRSMLPECAIHAEP